MSVAFTKLGQFEVGGASIDDSINQLHNLSHLCVAHKYGVIFAVDATGALVQAFTKDVISQNLSAKDASVTQSSLSWRPIALQLPSRIVHIAVDCTGDALAVVVRHADGAYVHVFSVVAIVEKSVAPSTVLAPIRITMSPTSTITSFRWSPTASTTFAVTEDAKVSVYSIDGGKLTIIGVHQLQGGKAPLDACWSPKGKQLIVGCNDGTIIQLKPEGQLVKTVPAPQPSEINSATMTDTFSVQSIHWLSTPQMAVLYSSKTNGQCTFCVLTIVKGAPRPQFTAFTPDVCYSNPQKGIQPTVYRMHHVSEWNQLICTSSASSESAVLQMSATNEWSNVELDDTARCELPVDVKRGNQEMYATGVAIEFSAPSPTLLQLTTGGILVAHRYQSASGASLQQAVTKITAPATAAVVAPAAPAAAVVYPPKAPLTAKPALSAVNPDENAPPSMPVLEEKKVVVEPPKPTLPKHPSKSLVDRANEVRRRIDESRGKYEVTKQETQERSEVSELSKTINSLSMDADRIADNTALTANYANELSSSLSAAAQAVEMAQSLMRQRACPAMQTLLIKRPLPDDQRRQLDALVESVQKLTMNTNRVRDRIATIANGTTATDVGGDRSMKADESTTSVLNESIADMNRAVKLQIRRAEQKLANVSTTRSTSRVDQSRRSATPNRSLADTTRLQSIARDSPPSNVSFVSKSSDELVLKQPTRRMKAPQSPIYDMSITKTTIKSPQLTMSTQTIEPPKPQQFYEVSAVRSPATMVRSPLAQPTPPPVRSSFSTSTPVNAAPPVQIVGQAKAMPQLSKLLDQTSSPSLPKSLTSAMGTSTGFKSPALGAPKEATVTPPVTKGLFTNMPALSAAKTTTVEKPTGGLFGMATGGDKPTGGLFGSAAGVKPFSFGGDKTEKSTPNAAAATTAPAAAPFGSSGIRLGGSTTATAAKPLFGMAPKPVTEATTKPDVEEVKKPADNTSTLDKTPESVTDKAPSASTTETATPQTSAPAEKETPAPAVVATKNAPSTATTVEPPKTAGAPVSALGAALSKPATAIPALTAGTVTPDTTMDDDMQDDSAAPASSAVSFSFASPPAAQATSGGLFGAQTTSTQGGGLFGTPAPSSGGGFGSFGLGGTPSAANANKNVFGGATSTPPTSQSNSLFGGPSANTTSPMFGGAPAQQQQPAAPSAFGGTAFGGSSAFGGSPSTGSAFGGSAFGGAAGSGGSAFGGSPAAAAPSAFGGSGFSAFAAKPAASFGGLASQTSGSVFGGASATPAPTGSAFGASAPSQPSAFGGSSTFSQWR